MYDQADFERDPGRYYLYKTARIAVPIKSIPELKVGQFVAVRYFDTRKTMGVGGVEMPIYEVCATSFQDGNDGNGDHHYLYACTLKDFCL